MTKNPENAFADIHLQGSLRPSQAEAVAVAAKQLDAGQKRLHIVAPPGAGKTVLGLYLWAHHVRRPAVVLSPNSAIQVQWADRCELFNLHQRDRVSTDPASPALLTSLTYQSVTLPRRGGDDLDAAAIELWREVLIDHQQAADADEADVWIEDLRRHNPDYFEQRLGSYRKQVRDTLAVGGEALSTLHESSLATLRRLREFGVGMIILDECHHLMGHWGRVLADASDLLDGPVVLGLTATPPDRRGRDPKDVARYDDFFGPVDFEVPVPALVKEGHLAPYQDLVYFVRPSSAEMTFIAQADQRFDQLVNELEAGEIHFPRLSDWLVEVLTERRLPTGPVKDWIAFERRDRAFTDFARLYLRSRKIALPKGVPDPPAELIDTPPPRLALLVPVLDRYIRHGLRRSPDPITQQLADRAIAALRMLGVQITETGAQPCASPVSRVMAYAREKTAAMIDILAIEHQSLGDQLRAVVVTDYEKTSATSAEVDGLLDEEAGGAVAAFRALLTDPRTDALNPILVTGSTVLVDDDLLETFRAEAQQYLAQRNVDVELSAEDQAGFAVITGRGADWSPRLYVAMITELFQRGLTRCLVGTRGLLGEGWDAHTVNVLIDLTTVTTSMSVNQLRGRSIRLNPQSPDKVANNWDVICLAGQFTQGLDDYRRFIEKHRTLFGVTDDGAIEMGSSHVHAALTELEPEGVEESMAALNDEMLARAQRRSACYDLWRIGEPYDPTPVRAVELKVGADGFGGFPPFAGRREEWSDQALVTAVGRVIYDALREAKLIRGGARVRGASRAGGYVRVFLQTADREAAELFTASLHEAMGPLDRPRYVVPRYVHEVNDTWLSSLLPEIVARYFRKRQQWYAMLHTVPSALARHKDTAAIYQRHWNRHVSPGEAVYAHHGEGERMVAEARRTGRASRAMIHEKDVFGVSTDKTDQPPGAV
ncbi:DEAD/DEAH box helicase family protein [Planctomycetales bacterium ZRK34]|nr:DEAD/DEAH box helicase family protein [Planctomycetales bacterium ZRK34]